jgi:ubiquinone/menaquinone biosynthesis C-methylase UbiE
MGEQADRLREEFFGQRARSYRESIRHARGQDLDRLLGHMGVDARGRALDLATGAGHVAVRLAEMGLSVTALDPTTAMLREAEDLARERGVEVQFVQAVAESLPFPDQTFAWAVCRRAAHHFTDLHQAMVEAARVLTPGGVLGVSDMTAPRETISDLNQLEQIRDPSHVQARTPDEWIALILSAGLRLQVVEVLVEPMSPEEWLSPVRPDEPEGAAALARIRDFAEPARSWISPEGRFLKYRILVVGRKPGSP